MRYRLMASYLGASYQAAVGPSDRDVTLFAAPPPPEEHGFSPDPGGVWRKQVLLDELEALWESRPIGSYRGEPCLVLDDFGDRLHIAYLGMDERRAGQLGYWQVDRGVFEVVIPHQDVTDLAEERHEFPIKMVLSALTRAPEAADPSWSPSSQMPPAAQPQAPARPLPQQVTGPRQATGPQTGPQQSPAVAAAWHGSPTDGNRAWYGHQPEITATMPGVASAMPGIASAMQGIADTMPGIAATMPGAGGASNGAVGYPGDSSYDLPTGYANDAASRNGSATMSPPYEPAPETAPQAPVADAPTGTGALAGSQPGSGIPAKADSRQGGGVRGRRAARKPRLAMSSVFADLLDMADIPRSAYAVDEEVTGAMCVIKTDGGYEVFSCAEEARHEVRFFEDEEAAYFYLFGVLAAEALRNGRLTPQHD